MRIAVLDNDRSQGELICQVLTSAGHICHSFQTAKDVLAQLRKDSYDMLILDWQVADMSGTEVLRRAKEKLPENAPTLFLTTSSGEDDIVAGLAAGADDYMIKPLRRSEMVARVQALLRRASVVFHDALVGPGVLDLIPDHVRRVSVGKRSGRHSRDQEAINRLLIEAASDGERVVRLKGGDPTLFARSARS